MNGNWCPGQVSHYGLTCQGGEELEFIKILTEVWPVVGEIKGCKGGFGGGLDVFWGC